MELYKITYTDKRVGTKDIYFTDEQAAKRICAYLKQMSADEPKLSTVDLKLAPKPVFADTESFINYDMSRVNKLKTYKISYTDKRFGESTYYYADHKTIQYILNFLENYKKGKIETSLVEPTEIAKNETIFKTTEEFVEAYSKKKAEAEADNG